MNPDRQAMIDGWKSPTRKDITSAKYDANTRVTKPYRPSPAQAKGPKPPKAGKVVKNQNFETQDEQERKFVADEDMFVLKQSKKKADIRVREGRAKPIDYLIFSLRWIDPDRDVFDDDDGDVLIGVPSPETLLERMKEAQLKELDEDIQSYSRTTRWRRTSATSRTGRLWRCSARRDGRNSRATGPRAAPSARWRQTSTRS